MGVYVLSRDTVKEDIVSVNMSPAFMTRVLAMRLVTASVEHIPRICLSTGLSFQSPALNISIFFGGLGISSHPFFIEFQTSLR
jgi:hypothetical protein